MKAFFNRLGLPRATRLDGRNVFSLTIPAKARAGNNDERYSARFKVAGTRRLRRACN